MKFQIICLSLAIFLVSDIQCRSVAHSKQPLSIGFSPLFSKLQASSWDIFVFAQEWPATVCSSSSHKKCQFPDEENYWTVHGLWPSKGTSGPTNCDTDEDFNHADLDPILEQMEQQWTNVFADTSKYSFWDHEWSKHGTCATELPETGTAVKYFQKGLDLNTKYNLKTILTEANIVPGNSYAVSDFVAAVEDAVGATPLVSCASGGTARIQEIRICFDKSFEPVDCPGSSSCKKTILYEAMK